MKKDIERAIKLFDAARKGDAALRAAKARIALDIVGQSLIENDERVRQSRAEEFRHLTEYDATDALARTLMERLGGDKSRFNLTTCSDEFFKEMWLLRQVIDRTGIAHPIYVDVALERLRNVGKRRIRVSMLADVYVMLHVMQRYGDEVSSYRRDSASGLDSEVDSVT